MEMNSNLFSRYLFSSIFHLKKSTWKVPRGKMILVYRKSYMLLCFFFQLIIFWLTWNFLQLRLRPTTSPRDPEVSSAFPPSVVVPIQASRAAPEKPSRKSPQSPKNPRWFGPHPKKRGVSLTLFLCYIGGWVRFCISSPHFRDFPEIQKLILGVSKIM